VNYSTSNGDKSRQEVTVNTNITVTMGRRWSRKNKKNQAGKKQDQKQQKNSGSNDNSGKEEQNPYKLVEHGNFKMEAYYAYQGIHDHYLVKEEDVSGNVVSYRFAECTTSEQKEEERQRFLEAFKGMLPASFRIGNDVDPDLRERLEHELDQFVGEKMKIEIEPRGGQRLIESWGLKPEIKFIAPVQKLPFIPHGYQLSVDRQTIRRSPKLQPFHDWLKVQTDAGFVTRQETVSMIPPVVLNPEPHHMVLDMAAAPGSKTSQLLEIVNLPSSPGDCEPKGCVVANDNDAKRAYMLVHQIKRINSPAVFITSTDARFFPLLRDPKTQDGTTSEGIFDSVLCDVPCSGDGTARKNPGIWKQWNSLNGYSLHPMQLAIALRGAQSTKVGGLLCYSTCSMNPIENEAVVAELLRASDGSLELVERLSQLPGLVARPGVSTWKVVAQTTSNKQMKDKQKKNNPKMQAKRKEWEEKNKKENGSEEIGKETEAGKLEAPESLEGPTNVRSGSGKEETDQDGSAPLTSRTKFEPTSLDDMDGLKKMIESVGMVEYFSYDEVPKVMRKRVRPSCFPPTPEEAKKFNLEHCMRIMPQDMNTGGFFVALFKKVAPLNSRAKKRFEELQNELQKDDKKDGRDVSSKETSGNGGSDDEPQVKKAKVESTAMESEDVDMKEQALEEGHDGEKDHDAAVDAEDAHPDEDYPLGVGNRKKPVHGFVKGNFLKGEDGKKSMTVGRDDYVNVPDDIFIPLREYYGLDEESFKEGQFMIRAGGDSKVLYFITKTVKTQLIDKGIQEKVTVVNSGLKAFVRNNKDCEVPYRVAQEGIHCVAPHMTKRILSAEVHDFEKCLSAPTVHIKDFSEEFAEQVRKLSMGSFVVYLKGFENDYIKKLVIVLWRCRGDAVNFLVTQAEIEGMRSKIRAITNKGQAEK